jgi:hypothetical protein
MKIFPARDKQPLTSNGLYDAKDEGEWRGDEGEQWGAPCGAVNGFLVVDVDKKSGGLETAAQFEWGDTLKVNTPSGGFHLFYKWDEATCGAIRNGVGVLPGIDIRSSGGYVILYADIDASKMKPLPGWVLTFLAEKQKKRLGPVSTSADDGIGEGGRNHYLSRAAGRLQREGVLTLSSLNELNESKCVPPLDESEVSAIYNSISRYEPASTPADDPVPPKKIVWANELVSDFLSFMRDKGKVQGDPTGLEELDKLLGGGKRLGELTVTAAEAKSGKNTLWHWLQTTQLDKGVPVGYASRELSPESEVLPNLLTIKLGKNLYKAKDLLEGDLVEAMKGWKLAFAPGYGAFQGNELFDWMDECRLFDVRYFYIDHLHYCLINSEDFQEVAELARKLKTYAKTHAVHIDLIIQPKGLDPSFPVDLDIHHIRGGASLGQVLDNLITLQRQRGEDGNYIDVTKVSLKRSRSKLSSIGSFFLQYNKELMTFRVVEEASSEPTPIEAVRPILRPRVEEDRPAMDNSRSASPSRGPMMSVEKAADNMAKRIRMKGAPPV